MINEIKTMITNQVESMFAHTFETYLTDDKLARSLWPMTQREPEMPQELVDMLD